MENLVLKIKKLENFVSMPEYKTSGASAMDLVAAIDDDIVIPSGEIRMIPTGIAIELPHNTEAQVRSRSGLAIKSGIAVVNGIGTIDGFKTSIIAIWAILSPLEILKSTLEWLIKPTQISPL